MKCRYCGSNTRITTGGVLYPLLVGIKTVKFLECTDCNANIMCQKNSEKPGGIIADAKLRSSRAKLFSTLNPMLQQKGKKARHKLLLGVQKASGTSTADINFFREKSCAKVLEYLNKITVEMHHG